MDPHDRIAALEEENADLRAQLEIVQRQLFAASIVPLCIGATQKEARVLGCLMQRDLASRDQLMTALYYDTISADEEPEVKIVDVFVCKLRKKLKPFGIEITSRWGQGYHIPQDSKDRMMELSGEDPAR